INIDAKSFVVSERPHLERTSEHGSFQHPSLQHSRCNKLPVACAPTGSVSEALINGNKAVVSLTRRPQEVQMK
ncbi:hypothetical protein J6590_015749, partial [Homalodisca vitripennis]